MNSFKKIKIAFLFSLLLAISFTSYAEEWKYKATDMFLKNPTPEIKGYFLDLRVVDYYIQRIDRHAGYYPPSFKDDKERIFIESKLKERVCHRICVSCKKI